MNHQDRRFRLQPHLVALYGTPKQSTILFTWIASPSAFGVQLSQEGNTFTVQYGSQIKSGMCVNEAAAELGGCIFHALSCEGRIVNG